MSTRRCAPSLRGRPKVDAHKQLGLFLCASAFTCSLFGLSRCSISASCFTVPFHSATRLSRVSVPIGLDHGPSSPVRSGMAGRVAVPIRASCTSRPVQVPKPGCGIGFV
ncbi:hypothetical protein LX32DRAFT_418419 [Colletotrichum zoysiae]|uniref:Uncharacterized protein n=1 Tax=Colletotrichum zoysiae TaxID=1216348 RepID=A0AAD9M5Q0_9PEZI|nr:hypothetical protein LX32DRAFT_418419 [Colletotrichum zoysiae]